MNIGINTKIFMKLQFYKQYAKTLFCIYELKNELDFCFNYFVKHLFFVAIG